MDVQDKHKLPCLASIGGKKMVKQGDTKQPQGDIQTMQDLSINQVFYQRGDFKKMRAKSIIKVPNGQETIHTMQDKSIPQAPGEILNMDNYSSIQGPGRMTTPRNSSSV